MVTKKVTAFTFQYGYSKTAKGVFRKDTFFNLHSNMVIVKQSLFLLSGSVYFTFTFQYGYSKTRAHQKTTLPPIDNLHSNMVIVKRN